MSVQVQTPTVPVQSARHNDSARRSQRLWNAMIILILLAGGVIMLTPFVWLVVSSLKPLEKVFIFPPEWIPDPVQWQNYPDALL